jgi:phosphoribosylglycinamide formyltransferase-1
MLHIAVFGSGRGSNFQALLAAMEGGKIPGARVGLVLSNSSTAGILAIAREHGLPAIHLSRAQFADDDTFSRAMLDALRSHGIDVVVLAGYMKKVPPQVVAAFRNRILNIHPALLPRFGGPGMYGLRVHAAVLAAGETESGATVHLVDEEYDRGAILLQRRVPVLQGDTPELLAARVLEAEHALYPDALRLVVEHIQAAQHS